MGIFDDKLSPQILSVGTTTNSPLKTNVILTSPYTSHISLIHQGTKSQLTFIITALSFLIHLQ